MAYVCSKEMRCQEAGVTAGGVIAGGSKPAKAKKVGSSFILAMGFEANEFQKLVS